MPIFEYYCYGCRDRTEIIESYDKSQEDHFCTKCKHGGKLKRLFPDSFSVQYKGSGFHNTDYKKKASTDSIPKPAPKKEPAPKGLEDL